MSTITTTNTLTPARKPDFIAFSIRQGKEKQAKWTEVGVAFRNKDQSLTILFSCIPLNGKMVLREPTPRTDS